MRADARCDVAINAPGDDRGIGAEQGLQFRAVANIRGTLARAHIRGANSS